MKKSALFAAVVSVVLIFGCARGASDDSGTPGANLINGGLIPPPTDAGESDTPGIVEDVVADVIPDMGPFPEDTTAPQDANQPERFTYIACITDTHIVESDGQAAVYLRQIGETLAAIPLDIKGAFVGGDIVFNLPYNTIDEYHNDPNDRFDIAQDIFDNFPVPVYPAMGNHDQSIGRLPREMSEQLFQEHFGVDPYYVVDLGTWKFFVLNNFHGPTQNPESPEYDLQTGSLGETQLAWLEDQLADGRPAILMLHFPLPIVADLPAFLEKHKDTVRLVLTGHSHSWVNLSDNYSVPNMIMGSSQYDADSFMVMELDNQLKTWRILNWDKFHWGTSYALPWSNDQ